MNIPVFPILIKKIENFITEEQRQDLIKYANNINLHEHSAFDINAKSSHTGDSHTLNDIVNNVNSCTNLIKNLEIHLQEFEKDSGFKYTKLQNSWINIQNKGSKLKEHTHPLSNISGVFFINADDDSSKLYFYNPIINLINYSNIDRSKNNIFSFKYINFKPQNGDLFLFPSWLLHGSDEDVNMTEQRICLSFNSI